MLFFLFTFILERAKLENMEIKDTKKLQKSAKKAAVLLKTLANAERLLILCHLLSGEQSAGELWQKSTLSQSAFSQHLAVLRKQNIVSTRKEMQTVYYSLENEDAVRMLESLYAIYCRA